MIVADEVDYGALIAAEKLGVPHATVIVLAAGGFARPAALAEPLNDVRARIGLEPDPDLKMLDRDLVIAPVPPSFRDPDFPLGPDTLWIRPAVLDAHIPAADPWPNRPDRTRVYVTLGTIFNMESGDLFDRLLEAVSGLDADVLVTVGRHLEPSAFGRVPEHVQIEQFIPHHVVLPRRRSGDLPRRVGHGSRCARLRRAPDRPADGRRSTPQRAALRGIGHRSHP